MDLSKALEMYLADYESFGEGNMQECCKAMLEDFVEYCVNQ